MRHSAVLVASVQILQTLERSILPQVAAKHLISVTACVLTWLTHRSSALCASTLQLQATAI
jgi:hypothetical protein